MPVLKVGPRYVGEAARIVGHDGGRVARMWCPGCEDHHMVLLDGPGAWGWNGDMERPTFTPSILVSGGSQNGRCHSFVTDGAWNYLTDCTHPLAGQIVPMVPDPGGVPVMLSTGHRTTDTLGRVLGVMPGVGCTCNVVWGGILPPPPCPVHSVPVGCRRVQPCPCGCGPDYAHRPPAWFTVTS